MAITANLVKELREKTGAGMMDCKKALQETDGDLDKAVEYLREKGMSKAAKKADRIAAEGSTHVVANDQAAAMIEVNAETDFVAKNDQFKELLNDLASHILNHRPATLDEAFEQKINGTEQTVSEYITATIATIGEKISLRRFEVFEQGENSAIGNYIHMGGKIGVLAHLDGTNDEAVAKDIAMHIAAINPQYLSRDEVDQDVVNKERERLKQQALDEGKPEHIVEKMVEGRLGKFFEEICLLDQAFVKDSDQTVKQYVESKGATIKTFVRYEVGEGMEKREENFADEVMSQVKK